jgi:hypothetical protein
MKTKLFILSISLLVMAAGMQASDKTIKGDKNVVTRTISITDYDEISIAGSMTFEYVQSDAAPFLSIMTDENLFEYLKVEVKDKRLIIGPKQRNSFNNSYNLKHTVFKIKSNSKDLRKLNTAGSGRFTVLSPLRVGELNVNLAGSGAFELKEGATGDRIRINAAGSGSVEVAGAITVREADINVAGSGAVHLPQSITGDRLKLNLAGSGKLTADHINAESLQCRVAGSGSARIEGKAGEAEYSVAGSGKIQAYGCKADRVKAGRTGSGDIELYAGEELSASTMGSGSISYKGNPASVRKSPAGSRSIRQVQ